MQGDMVLSAQDRSDLMRAAIAYSLADDALALDRLRAKFAAKMADSVDARTFALVTQPNGVASPAFRQIARRVTTADTLADFLAEYRKRYPDAAAAARPRQLVTRWPRRRATPSVSRPPSRARGATRSAW